MSKGLGRIEQVIQRSVKRDLAREGLHGSVLISSWHIVDKVYSNWRPSRAQQLAVNRAMKSFVRKFPRFALAGGQGRKRLFLYDTANPNSVAWAQATMATKGPVAYCQVEGRKSRNRPLILLANQKAAQGHPGAKKRHPRCGGMGCHGRYSATLASDTATVAL
jgi:hypothetical protein